MSEHDKAVMALLREFGKAFNKGDVDGILACVTDDFEWRLAEGPDRPDGRIVRGKEEVRAALQERDREIAEMRFSETEVTITADSDVVGLPSSPISLDYGEVLEFYVHGTTSHPGDFFIESQDGTTTLRLVQSGFGRDASWD